MNTKRRVEVVGLPRIQRSKNVLGEIPSDRIRPHPSARSTEVRFLPRRVLLVSISFFILLMRDRYAEGTRTRGRFKPLVEPTH